MSSWKSTIQLKLNEIDRQIVEAACSVGRRAEEISLLPVSKGQSLQAIRALYDLGFREFAENRLEEALTKIGLFPIDVKWHFIGKIQTKKIPKIIGLFELIHSVDSLDLALKLSEASLERGVVTKILLQANTSNEMTKSGLSEEEWESGFVQLLDCRGIEICGLMTMAPLTKDEQRIRSTFSKLRFLRERLQQLGGKRVVLTTLSMGMSSDFSIAIQEGSTLVRIGSALFPSGEDS